MLETTNHNDWLEAEITRIAALHKGERNPAVVKLVAEAKARGYPQKKADVDKMVKAASRAAKDDRSEMTSEDVARSREFTLEPGGYAAAADMYLRARCQWINPVNYPVIWTIAHWRGKFYHWNGPKWVPFQSGQLEAIIHNWLTDECCLRLVDPDGNEWFEILKTTSNMVKEILIAIRARTWRDGEALYGGLAKYDISNPISVSNGILDLDTLVLWAHTPELFNTSAVTANWNPDAPQLESTGCGQWLLDALGGAEQLPLVQEFLGYLLSGRTDAQKAAMIIGPKRSGKGTFGRLIEGLMGGCVTSLPTRSLENDFGMQHLVDKSVAIMPDVRIDRHTNLGALAEVLLTVIGEDHRVVNRKNIDPWEGHLLVRFLLMSNSVPKLRDSDGVLYSRFLFIEMPKSHYGEEDTKLGDRIMQDVDALLHWGVMGMKRLIGNKMKFTTSATHSRISERAQVRLDPVGTWIAAELEITRNAEDVVSTDEMFSQFNAFAQGHNIGTFTKDGFSKLFWEKDLDGVQRTRSEVGRGARGVRLKVSQFPDLIDATYATSPLPNVTRETLSFGGIKQRTAT